MQTKFTEGKNGYQIPYTEAVKGNEKKVVIVSHGFGSSKNCPTAEMLIKNLPAHGMGVIAFDFPSHGESPADGEDLRIGNCLDDLQSIEELVKDKAPNAEIYYFSSSFGAYINLIYLSKYEHAGSKSFLRSAAVNMPERFGDPTAPELADLKKQGYAIVDHGYDRPLKITEGILEDFAEYNLFELYKPSKTKTKMIHGDCDEIIDFEKAKQFSEKFKIDMTVVTGGDHRLSIPGAEAKVLAEALEFFGA